MQYSRELLPRPQKIDEKTIQETVDLVGIEEIIEIREGIGRN
jgi:hypothetical protein